MGAIRLNLEVGLTLNTSSQLVMDRPLSYGGGYGVSVFANLAEFLTNFTDPGNGSMDGDCDELAALEYYDFHLGAAVGPSLVFDTQHWVPAPTTSDPVYYTTLDGICASSAALTGTTANAASLKRQDLTTTTFTSTAYFSATRCRIRGLANCPASDQVLSTFRTVSTLVTAVPSGETPTFPVTSVASVTSTSPFGTNVKSIPASTGPLRSYAPSSTASTASGKTGGVPLKTILGVSIGLGIPALMAVIAV